MAAAPNVASATAPVAESSDTKLFFMSAPSALKQR
jgi:hypothetical protein